MLPSLQLVSPLPSNAPPLTAPTKSFLKNTNRVPPARQFIVVAPCYPGDSPFICFPGHPSVVHSRNRQETLDKDCVSGAEWGVGDCSAAAMSLEDRDSFISLLKENGKNEMRGGVQFLGRKAACCIEFHIKVVVAAKYKK